MISKNERVMDYIARLEAGEKVSVRKLAQELGVSEGTAYKSIKQAEAQGLVTTKPKAGTVRINIRGEEDEGGTTLAEAARSVGAMCLCGAEIATDISLPHLVVGDGSPEQFADLLHRSGGKCLCVIGDRPELHETALEHGCHIMLTGGCVLNDELLRLAEEKRLCVFASEQNSSTLLGMLHRRVGAENSQKEMTRVRDWMQLPRYLYHDDMVSEWYRLYSELFYHGSGCAVVDDRLQICGTVEAMTAMNAPPAARLSEIMDGPSEDCWVGEDTSMEELAEMFVKSGRLFCSVNSEDGMSGFVGMSDVIRYFLYNKSYHYFDSSGENRLELTGDDSDNERRMYMLKLKNAAEKMNRSIYINSIYSAAAWHAYSVLGGPVEFESGSINSLEPITKEGEYLISSNLLKRSGDALLLELELFNDQASYAKASLRYRVAD